MPIPALVNAGRPVALILPRRPNSRARRPVRPILPPVAQQPSPRPVRPILPPVTQQPSPPARAPDPSALLPNENGPRYVGRK